MQVSIPYGRDKVEVSIDEANLAGIVVANEVPVGDENETIRQALEHPIQSESLTDFLKEAEEPLIIVNDATRPTPTARVLEIISPLLRKVKPKFIVATGNHRAPTGAEYKQIFGSLYEEYRARIYAHNSHADKEMTYLGKSRNGTELYVNKLVTEASDIIVISSVEPHYFAGYTGGRKSFFPGLASYKSIEQNHKHAMDPRAKSLALEGNPVHEDMVDAMKALRYRNIFSIMTVLDRDHRVYAAAAGEIHRSFFAAAAKANEVFAVKIREEADIVVAAARRPMDIDLYQSQKALEHGKLALKEGGILILVSACPDGTGDDTFIKLLSSCKSAAEVSEHIAKGYVLGYHKAAKLAEINLWAEMYAVTGLPDKLLKSIHLKPFESLQQALDAALKKKGKNARVLFMPDGSLTVPVVG